MRGQEDLSLEPLPQLVAVLARLCLGGVATNLSEAQQGGQKQSQQLRDE